MSANKLPDPVLADHISRIKLLKPDTPSQDNCLDFSLGDSGHCVRVILTWEEDRWVLSTSIGLLIPGKYTPMLLDYWTEPLRRSATSCVDEILEHFDIDHDSKEAITRPGHVAVIFRFKENERVKH